MIISLLLAAHSAHAAPPEAEPETIDEAIDLSYSWFLEVEDQQVEEVEGWTTAHLSWEEDDCVDPNCESRWGRGWCGVGTFITEDGGEGVAELGVRKDGRRRLRTITLLYDGTGAAYFGELRLKRLGALYTGTMDLEDAPEWTGAWDEPLRVGTPDAEKQAKFDRLVQFLRNLGKGKK